MKIKEQLADFREVQFSGVAQVAGVPGRNGNIYTVEGWERAIEVYRAEMIETRRSFGMMDHQYDFTLQNSAFIITDLFLNERNEVICEAVTIPTSNGVELGGLLQDPNVGQISVSTSIYVGSPTFDAAGNAIYGEFRLESIDAVTDPSFTEAIMIPENDEQRRRRKKDYEGERSVSKPFIMKRAEVKEDEGNKKENLDLLFNFLASSDEREKQSAQMSGMDEKLGKVLDILEAAFPGEYEDGESSEPAGSVSGGNMPDIDLMGTGLAFSKNKDTNIKVEENMEFTKEKMTEELNKTDEVIVEKTELEELRKLKESVESEKREKKLTESKEFTSKLNEALGKKEEEAFAAESFIKGEEKVEEAMKVVSELMGALEASKKETEAARENAVKPVGKSDADINESKSQREIALEQAEKNGRKVPNKSDYKYAQEHSK